MSEGELREAQERLAWATGVAIRTLCLPLRGRWRAAPEEAERPLPPRSSAPSPKRRAGRTRRGAPCGLPQYGAGFREGRAPPLRCSVKKSRINGRSMIAPTMNCLKSPFRRGDHWSPADEPYCFELCAKGTVSTVPSVSSCNPLVIANQCRNRRRIARSAREAGLGHWCGNPFFKGSP